MPEAPTLQSPAHPGLPVSSQPDTDRLVHEHLPLVDHIVRSVRLRIPAHVALDDLVAAGRLALVQAARNFDASRGVPFEPYARIRVRGAVVDELRGTDWASRSVRRRARDIEEARSTLTRDLGRQPRTEEVAHALGLDVAEVQANIDDVARARVGHLFLDEDDSSAAASLVESRPGPEEVLERRERLSYVAAAITELPDRLRAVVEDYYLHDLPMAHTAERLDVSESRVSQMRAEALVLMRDAINTALDPHLVPAPERPDGAKARRRTAYYAAVAAQQMNRLRPQAATGEHTGQRRTPVEVTI